MTKPRGEPRETLYRVWIARCDDWRPRRWNDVPPKLVILEPAEPGYLSATEAALYVAAFNRAVIALPRRRWAVAVPISVRLEGDLVPGQRLLGRELNLSPLAPLASEEGRGEE